MTRWYEGPLAAFDTETTGVDVERDRIVAAAVVCQEAPGVRATAESWLVDPGVAIPAGAVAVHGLTEERLRAEGRPPGVALDGMVRALLAASRRGLPLVVMNAPFDLTLLDRELRRHRGQDLASLTSPAPLRVLDPRVLDKHLDRYRKGRRTLTDLCHHYGVRLEDAHEASADALAALEVVRAVGRAHHERLAELSPPRLHALQVVWHAAQARGLQQWFSRNGGTEPVDPAWPMRETYGPAA